MTCKTLNVLHLLLWRRSAFTFICAYRAPVRPLPDVALLQQVNQFNQLNSFNVLFWDNSYWLRNLHLPMDITGKVPRTVEWQEAPWSRRKSLKAKRVTQYKVDRRAKEAKYFKQARCNWCQVEMGRKREKADQIWRRPKTVGVGFNHNKTWSHEWRD